MAALSEVLRILIDSNSAGAQADMKKLGLTASDTMTKLEKLKSAAMVGAGIGVGAAAVGGVVEGLQRAASFGIAQGKAAVEQASQLQQAQATVTAVFEGSALSLEKFAATADRSLGLSKAAFLQNTAAVGSLLQNLGYTQVQAAATSAELVTIAADLGAAFGRSTEDAMQGLTALLRGEFDTIEKFGIKIKEVDIQARAQAMGLDMSTVAAKNNATAIAALSLATEQAAKFQGTFGERSDTLLGQQQRLRAEWANTQAELGEKLLPALTSLTENLRDSIPVVARLAEQVLILANAYLAVQNAAIAAGKAVFEWSRSDTARWAEQVINNLDEVAITATQLPPALAEGLNKYLASFSEAITYTADEINKLNDAALGAAAVLRDEIFGGFTVQNSFRKAVTDTGSAVSDTAAKMEKAYQRIEDAQQGVIDAQEALNEAMVNQFLTSLGATSDEITEAQIGEREATRSLTQSKRELAKALSDLTAMREIDRAGVMDAQAAYIQAQRDVVDAERSGDAVKLLRANAELIRSRKALNEQLDPTTSDEYAIAQERVGAAQDGVLQAEIDLRKARQELVDVTNRGKEGSKELAEANKQLTQAQRALRDADQALTDANEQLLSSTDRVAGSQKSVNDRLLEGVGAADGWVQYLIRNKRPVDEWNSAISEIYQSLKDVADQSGQTGSLDAFISRATEAYRQIKNIQNLPVPGAAFSSDPMNAFTSVDSNAQTRVVMQLDGKTFGEAVVAGLLAYQNTNGAVPIKVR